MEISIQFDDDSFKSRCATRYIMLLNPVLSLYTVKRSPNVATSVRRLLYTDTPPIDIA